MGKKLKKLTSFITGGGSGEGSEKSKDEVRRENESLSDGYDQVLQEYKKLKSIIEQLERDYEESKDYDMLRRYGLLKGMIKRTIMHLKLSKQDNDSGGGRVGGLNATSKEYARQAENFSKREEKYHEMSSTELSKVNEELQEQIKECKRKISMIDDLIDHLGRDYESSKRYIPVQRYRLMKSMVKIIIQNKYI